MSPQPARGKRRAERPKRRRRGRETKPAGGKRADRPQNHEGLTPEFLDQLRETESELVAAPKHTFPGRVGVREVLAGIDGDLRGDQEYLQALSRLAYG